jgi:hypothetical protein
MTDSATWARALARSKPAQPGNVKATRDDGLDVALTALALEGVDHVTVLDLKRTARRVAVEFLLVFQESR